MKSKKIDISIISIIAAFVVVIGGIVYNDYKEKSKLIDNEATETTSTDYESVADATETINADYKSIVETTDIVQVSNNLTFELPTNIENFTETQYTELEDFLYEQGWDTISAYYNGIYGENPRKVISEINLEPVKAETITHTEWQEFTDENGNTTMQEVESYSFATVISYLLYSSRSDIETSRLTICYWAPIENGRIDYNAINRTCINKASESIDAGYYTLVEGWQGDKKLYKVRVNGGFPVLEDEYFDVHSGSWGSDSEDLKQYHKELEQKQKEYWPASANSSWDNLLDLGAQFQCDADTDIWYALIGSRVCYWIPIEKEWMTEYDLLFETYYLTSTDGINYKLYKMIDGRRTWQLGFDRTLTADGSLIVE